MSRWPISIMAMTAATPMTMPSVVRAARMMLRRRPCRAVRTIQLEPEPRQMLTAGLWPRGLAGGGFQGAL